MTTPEKENPSVAAQQAEAPPKRPLSAAAERALAEAAERRAAADHARAERVKEVGGREGPEPTRYGDWEKGGIVSDF
jgi:hypothetical protein